MEDYKKKYKGLMKNIEHLYESVNPEWKRTIEHYIPELKESESEKIRKELIYFVRRQIECHDKPNAERDEIFDSWISWLEKQKDHEEELERAYKTADEVQYRRGYEAAKREFEKQGEQKLILEDAAKAFLEALSDTPYNNTPITEAQIVTKQLLTFLSDPKFYNPNAINEQKSAKCIQWTGKNLKEVIDFTGKSARFDEWFKSWDEYEAYVHSHGDIFKLFCTDGSHYEVPVGAWIVKTPDGYNIPSSFRFIPKLAEWSEEDEEIIEGLNNCLDELEEGNGWRFTYVNNKDIELNKIRNWLKSLKERIKEK